MCGIVGFCGAREAAPVILEGLKKLEYRGYDSSGVAIVANNAIDLYKCSGKIKNLCEKSEDGALLRGTAGVGQTRWATHGAPTDKNAHPHMSESGRFAVVHNGIIENYAVLREELTQNGYKFKSETDTEVIAALLDTCYDGDF